MKFDALAEELGPKGYSKQKILARVRTLEKAKKVLYDEGVVMAL